MNILDKIAAVPGMPKVIKGYLPDQPDDCISIFEYPATPPEQSFGRTDIIHNIQARSRGSTAYAMAQAVVLALNRYSDGGISVIQSTAILDIGYDSAGRQEYTVNFEIRRY